MTDTPAPTGDTSSVVSSGAADCLYNDILVAVQKWTRKGETPASLLTQIEMAFGVFIAFYSLPGQQHVIIQAVANNLPIRVADAIQSEMQARATVIDTGHA